MISVKNIFDTVGPHDGLRIWIEPVRLARNLAEWCEVDFLLPEIAPPKALWDWFELHPSHYEIFRQRYQDCLSDSSLAPVLEQLALSGIECNVTLLHEGDDPHRNTATALHEFLAALYPSFYRHI
jgi:uncharacterized protein YeaO (DUF488 family)